MRKIIHSKFELDLSNKKLTDNSENPMFSDKFTAKSVFPFEISLTDDIDFAFGFISYYNSTDALTCIPVTYNHNNVISDAILEIEEIKGDILSAQVFYGFDEFPNFSKKLKELLLAKFEVANIYTHAASIISQTWPAVNYNFPQIHIDKIDTDDEVWSSFEGILNNYKSGAFLINEVIGDVTHNRNILQPLPYLPYIIKQGFLESGWTVTGNFINHPLIKKLCLYSDSTYYTTYEQQSYTVTSYPADAVLENQTINGTFPYPYSSWITMLPVTNPIVPVYKHTIVTTIDDPGKYRVVGKIKGKILPYRNTVLRVKYRNVVIWEKIIVPNSQHISAGNTGVFNNAGAYFVKNVDVVFETLSDILPNDITIETESGKFWDNDNFDIEININPIRLHDISGEAIPTVLNPNQIDLTRAVADMTFGELNTTIKNLFNLSYNFKINNELEINFVQDIVEFGEIKDLSKFEIKNPSRKPQKGNSFALKYQDVNSEEYKYDSIYHSINEIGTTPLTANEKTQEITINAIPLPLTLRNGVQTAHDFEASNSKVTLVIYDGLTGSLNLAKPIDDLLIPKIHEQFYKKWFERRLNSILYTWSFIADGIQLLNFKPIDKIHAYKNIHMIKTIQKTEIDSDLFEVEIETEV